MKMSRIETAVRLTLAYYEAFNKQDIPAMMALLSDDCRYEHHTPGPGGTLFSGKDAITHFWLVFFGRSPGAHIEIEEIFGLGYRSVARWRFQAAEDLGQQRGVDIFQIKNNQIVEQLSYTKT